MNYQQALHFIHNTNKFASRLGLDNMKILMDLLNNPQEKLKFIHIAGTNGKGSTSALIHNILKAEGYGVGLFISPYLEEFTERIQVNGEPIEKKDLASITSQVKMAIEKMISQGYEHPTEFEIVTAIGFLYFVRKDVDFVVLEVGLGGRLDATNIISTSEISIITAIGWDHMAQLGNSLVEIAGEKAGIIKKNGRVVVYPQSSDIQEEIRKKAEKKNAKVHLVKKESIKLLESSIEGQIFSYRGESLSLSRIETRLLGRHQLYNAATALKAIEVLKHKGYQISENSILHGIKNTLWPGRFEVISKNPYIILDGAHNTQGIQAFVNSIKEYFPTGKIILLLGILKDKEVHAMLEILLPIVKEVITLTPNSPRAMPAKELANVIKNISLGIEVKDIDSIEAAIAYIKQYPRNEILAFTGSLYMIGEVRRRFKE